MEFRQLEYFMRIYETGSITAAAESLFMTQPALSKSIRKLEDELEITLFEVNGRKVHITEAGRVLYQQGKNIIALYENTMGMINSLKNRESGLIRIVTSYQRGMLLWVYDMIEKYENLHPQVTFEVVEKSPQSVRKSIIAGEAELGLTNRFGMKEIPGITDHVLMHSELWLIARGDHPLMQKDSLESRDFRNVNIFTNYEDLNQLFVEDCIRHGFQPNIRFVTTQFDTIVSLVQKNRGVGLVSMTPEPMMHYMEEYGFPQWTQDDAGFGRRRIENEKFRYDMVLCMRSDGRKNALADDFVLFLEQDLCRMKNG